ncbi:MBL fold metallo-hydrolase [Deinococcus irradiatisoli]|uniref:MBL fold metallo-hydrolase n=1 Tax=Deinococcus irradiatisoli TaxID=2202254 RepID=A0A2Z3JBZ0_9DEIO|nr:MBL fold metallo-hydrolase [Deinococcus irradiatisoli]AWN22552.1 MBL fold metallo-hydrolase [Deinococcus irradiatisoli]
MSAVRVVALSAGECLNLEALTRRGAPWRPHAYPAGFALLLHPRHGPVLFDTGYTSRVLASMRRWPGWLYGLVTPVRFTPHQSAAAQLVRRGFTPGDVRHLIVSHLHADHVGALRDFPAATFHLDASGWAALRGLRGMRAVRRAYLPELLPPDFEGRCQPLQYETAPPGLAPFDQVADVFGDGLVYALPVPGHAPGMIALVVRTSPGADLNGAGQGLTLLASDVAWNVDALRQGGEVHSLARLAFWNATQERLSRQWVRQWLAAHPQARVIVSHDEPEAAHV